MAIFNSFLYVYQRVAADISLGLTPSHLQVQHAMPPIARHEDHLAPHQKPARKEDLGPVKYCG
jgi:hypothetical protein